MHNAVLSIAQCSAESLSAVYLHTLLLDTTGSTILVHAATDLLPGTQPLRVRRTYGAIEERTVNAIFSHRF